MNTKVIKVELERWMYTVKSKDGQEGQVFGSVQGSLNLMIVSVKPNGKGMYYCTNCKAFFPLKLNECPECGKSDPQPKLEGASTALDGHIF